MQHNAVPIGIVINGGMSLAVVIVIVGGGVVIVISHRLGVLRVLLESRWRRAGRNAKRDGPYVEFYVNNHFGEGEVKQGKSNA